MNVVMRHALGRWLAVAGMAGLSGCIVIADPTTLPAAPVAAQALAAAPADPGLAGQAAAIYGDLRRARGLAPLAWNGGLAAAAQAHATDMAANGFRGHAGSDGSNFVARARLSGGSCPMSEVITWGSSGVEGAYRWWMNSPDHVRALMLPEARSFGLGRAENIWVMVLGRC